MCGSLPYVHDKLFSLIDIQFVQMGFSLGIRKLSDEFCSYYYIYAGITTIS